jgi:transposase
MFYRGDKVTLIGAITVKKVLTLMTLDGSLDGTSFDVFIEHFLVPQLWPGAVVVMDNLSVHKMRNVVPKIEAADARVIYLSPYSPDFNPIELWWSQLKSFVRRFASGSTALLDRTLAVALRL